VLKNTFAGFVAAVDDDAVETSVFAILFGAVCGLDAMACLLGMPISASSQELGSRLFDGRASESAEEGLGRLLIICEDALARGTVCG
jgi:hypothetical protein